MPNGMDIPRRETDFTYPLPSVAQKLRALLAAAPTYAEGIDESKYQYSATRKVDHAAALAGGVTFTVIRVSNCVTADPYFEQAWTDAMTAGMPVMIYANVQGYKSGLEQAEFAMKTAEPFIKACKTKIVLWGDYEADGLTMSTAARQKLALDFLNGIHAHHETGIYSNVKYWGEMYGNLKPPAWAWLWGAHWTNVTPPQFPSSWDLSKLLIWQYGVWDNYSWAKPVPGNAPDIDKDRWMWSGGSVAEFLALPQPPTPEPGEHTHLELQAQIDSLKVSHNDVVDDLAALNNRIAALSARVIALEAKPAGSSPFVWFTPDGGSCVIQRASKWYKTSAGVDKPIFAPVGDGAHPKINGKARVFPVPLTGDGGQVCYMLLDQLIDGETVYVRRQDGKITA